MTDLRGASPLLLWQNPIEVYSSNKDANLQLEHQKPAMAAGECVIYFQVSGSPVAHWSKGCAKIGETLILWERCLLQDCALN